MNPSLLSAGSLFPSWPGRGSRVTQPPCRYETSGRGSSGQRACWLMQCWGPEPVPSIRPPRPRWLREPTAPLGMGEGGGGGRVARVPWGDGGAARWVPPSPRAAAGIG